MGRSLTHHELRDRDHDSDGSDEWRRRCRQPIGPAGNSVAGRTASGDLYAGHDGNVYKNEGGSWQKYDNGGWNNVQASGQLHNDWAARGEGATRSSEFSGMRSRGEWGSGSFRPSGGGFRGFGGRR